MTLQAALDAFKADFIAGNPPCNASADMHPAMARATAELIASGQAARALKAGDKAPAFILDDTADNPVSSAAMLARGPLMINFCRGLWCPYCNIELAALDLALPALRAAGASLVAISPQLTQWPQPARRRRHAGSGHATDGARATLHGNVLEFPLLRDAHNAVAAAFGLRYTLPDYLIALYRRRGNELPACNGDDSWTLPMPARYVIGQDSVILYAEVNPDYTQRPEPADMLAALGPPTTTR